ncbi:hypothetical protein GCM10011273_18340 [Asticcacaulis endophyticus]|uniref:AAA+ ATPase domain-containing protein n=1 Tax=Asticcacaulis endophyticus TaxID=1395890 RepID=A0A918UTC6_9CAUL|nr:hypothetical protein GCM10011273_18340 [Asticcacaulis endophyticus]
MGQIVRTFPADAEIGSDRYFAVAIERTTTRIEQAVQEVLDLTRSVPDATEFFTLLDAPGRSNAGMRDFVTVFTDMLKQAGDTADNARVFDILRRFHVLVFDFNRQGSLSEFWDKERASRLEANASITHGLYNTLFQVLLSMDGAGGKTTRDHLVQALQAERINLQPNVDLSRGRRRLRELSNQTLADINSSIASVHMARHDRLETIETRLDAAVETGGCVELFGEGGVGKSALLQALAGRRNPVCPIVVLAPDRTPAGGWAELRQTLGTDASLAEFITSLAGDGGSLICIDGLDRFLDPGQQKTIADILSAGLGQRGISTLITARPGWDKDGVTWLPDQVMTKLDGRTRIDVDSLTDTEADQLGQAFPPLSSLLKPSHPAKTLVRNLFRLRRLLGRKSAENLPGSEAAMAVDWWGNGDAQVGDTEPLKRAKRRILTQMAAATVGGMAVVASADMDDAAVNSLIVSKTLREHGRDDVTFAHDVLSDWAIANYIADDLAHLDTLHLDRQVPPWMRRAIELAAQITAEDPSTDRFEALLTRLRQDGIHTSWSGTALMALGRSDRAGELLDRFSDLLLSAGGALASELIRRAKATESLPADLLFQAKGIANPPTSLLIPAGPVWDRLIRWALKRFGALPSETFSDALDLFEHRMLLYALPITDDLGPQILEACATVLVTEVQEQGERRTRRHSQSSQSLPSRPSYPTGSEDIERAKRILGLYARHAPASVAKYLDALAASDRPVRIGSHIVKGTGSWASVAPVAFAAAVRSMVLELKRGHERRQRSDGYGELYAQLERNILSTVTGSEPFLDLLIADKTEGLALIHELVGDAAVWANRQATGEGGAFDVALLGKTRKVRWPWSFLYARGQGQSRMVTEALCALVYWGHCEIDSGRAIDEVVADILGDGDISAALLLVAIDLTIRHNWVGTVGIRDILSSPEVLALDANRKGIDQLGLGRDRSLGVGKSGAYVTTTIRTRLCLHEILDYYLFYDAEVRVAETHSALEAAQARYPVWESDVVTWTDPAFMVGYALRALDKASYEEEDTVQDNGEIAVGYRFRLPAHQQAWLDRKLADLGNDRTRFETGLAVRMSLDEEREGTKALLSQAEELWRTTSEAVAHIEVVESPEPEDAWLARLAAAAVLVRDMAEDELALISDDISDVLATVMAVPASTHGRMSQNVMYNAQSLAAVGLIFNVNRFGRDEDQRLLLEAAARHGNSVLSACLAHPSAVKALPTRLVVALFRLGLEGCISWRRKDWEEPEGSETSRRQKIEDRRIHRLAAEIDWVLYDGPEPGWPEFPLRNPSKPRGVVLSAETFEVDDDQHDDEDSEAEKVLPVDEIFYAGSAAHWLEVLAFTAQPAPDWIDRFLEYQASWLLHLHGMGRGTSARDTDAEWTLAIFRLYAQRARSWSDADLEQRLFQPLALFKDEPLFAAVATFLVTSDGLYLIGQADDTAYLVGVRHRLWDLLQLTGGWKHHAWRSGLNIEWHLSRPVCALYFKVDYGFSQTAYTKGLTPEQITPFLPLLCAIARAAPKSGTTALLLLDVVKCVPSALGTSSLVDTVLCWWRSGVQSNFWTDGNLGADIANYINVSTLSPDVALAMTHVADAMVAAGIPSASSLSDTLQTHLNGSA